MKSRNVTPIEQPLRSELPADQIDSYEAVIDLVRRGKATTRRELIQVSGMGRSIVAERMAQAMARGLIAESDLAPSTTRGRTPRSIRFVSERAWILVGSFGALGVGVAVADLSGNIVASKYGPWSIDAGPETSLDHLLDLFDEVLQEVPRRDVWGVAVGLPGPVEFATGRPVLPPIMPGWNSFDVRGYVADRLKAPVWVDNDANLMTLGEVAAEGLSPDSDMLFLKISSGIGAGLISHGKLHRGANGSAGDLGHIAVTGYDDVVCRCGRRGCLEAVASGWALARDGEAYAKSGQSPFLLTRLEEDGVIRPLDVLTGSAHGDPGCSELVIRAARLIGETVSGLVSFFNPSVIALGGAIPAFGDPFLSTIRQAVFSRALFLATRDLQFVVSSDNANLAFRGGAELVIEELFSAGKLRRWFAYGSPLENVEGIYQNWAASA